MASSRNQRYRPNCPYFVFSCKPAGKYALECAQPWYRTCKEPRCTAAPTDDLTRIRRELEREKQGKRTSRNQPPRPPVPPVPVRTGQQTIAAEGE